VVCDVKPGSSPTVLAGLPENLSPGQLTWTQDSKALVGVAWENNPRRLGLIYCTNRPGHIFQLSLDGSYRKSFLCSKNNIVLKLKKFNCSVLFIFPVL
jgi:acylaminoacyl-peptidase